jgi:hypothetical protein
MSFLRQNSKLVVVALTCLVLGAGASAIASAGAASSGPAARAHRAGFMGARGRRWLARAVEGSAVVSTKQGYKTISFHRGKVTAVHGQQLTIAVGNRRSTYETVTLTIPTDAVVRDNRERSNLSHVAAGQRVIVIQAPKRTLVIAHTPRRA